jgi:hypothetical protein
MGLLGGRQGADFHPRPEEPAQTAQRPDDAPRPPRLV